MMTAYYAPKTRQLLDLNYVFRPHWSSPVFAEGNALQLSDQDEETRIRIPFTLGCKVLLGRASAGSTDDLETQTAVDDATISTVSHEFRQQLLHLAATTEEEQARAETLRNAVLPLIDLQPFKADMLGVSRKHALLERDGRYIALTDLRSTNGTCLNGSLLFPLQRRILRDGDEVQLGKLRLLVRFCKSQRGD